MTSRADLYTMPPVNNVLNTSSSVDTGSGKGVNNIHINSYTVNEGLRIGFSIHSTMVFLISVYNINYL